jgi:hypothetical protein
MPFLDSVSNSNPIFSNGDHCHLKRAIYCFKWREGWATIALVPTFLLKSLLGNHGREHFRFCIFSLEQPHSSLHSYMIKCVCKNHLDKHYKVRRGRKSWSTRAQLFLVHTSEVHLWNSRSAVQKQPHSVAHDPKVQPLWWMLSQDMLHSEVHGSQN